MNRANKLHNNQPEGEDFRPQVLVTLALLLTIAHLIGPGLSNWFVDAGKKTDTAGQYAWISFVDGTSGLYHTDKALLEGESDPVSIRIKEDGQIVQSVLPAKLAPFFFLPISLNRADAELLMTLPGIGPKFAERIIALREKNGRIERVEELLHISGINRRKLSSFASRVSCE